MGTKKVKDLDISLGEKIEYLRVSKSMTRTYLAEKLGITHQQLQKYERGINRISVSRLSEVAEYLDVNLNYFFNDNNAGSLATMSAEVHEISELLNRIKDKSKLVTLKNLIATMS